MSNSVVAISYLFLFFFGNNRSVSPTLSFGQELQEMSEKNDASGLRTCRGEPCDRPPIPTETESAHKGHVRTFLTKHADV